MSGFFLEGYTQPWYRGPILLRANPSPTIPWVNGPWVHPDPFGRVGVGQFAAAACGASGDKPEGMPLSSLLTTYRVHESYGFAFVFFFFFSSFGFLSCNMSGFFGS